MAKPAQAAKPEQGPLGTWGIVLMVLVAAGLVAASVMALSRALKGPADEAKASLPEKEVSAAAAVSKAVEYPPLSQEELDREHAANYRAPIVRPPAPPKPAPPKPSKAVVLQQTKNSVNEKLVEKLRQFARDNPHRDSRELQKQIELREKLIVPVPEEKKP